MPKTTGPLTNNSDSICVQSGAKPKRGDSYDDEEDQDDYDEEDDDVSTIPVCALGPEHLMGFG